MAKRIIGGIDAIGLANLMWERRRKEQLQVWWDGLSLVQKHEHLGAIKGAKLVMQCLGPKMEDYVDDSLYERVGDVVKSYLDGESSDSLEADGLGEPSGPRPLRFAGHRSLAGLVMHKRYRMTSVWDGPLPVTCNVERTAVRLAIQCEQPWRYIRDQKFSGMMFELHVGLLSDLCFLGPDPSAGSGADPSAEDNGHGKPGEYVFVHPELAGKRWVRKSDCFPKGQPLSLKLEFRVPGVGGELPQGLHLLVSVRCLPVRTVRGMEFGARGAMVLAGVF